MNMRNPILWIFGVALVLRLVLWSFQVSALEDDGERYFAECCHLVNDGVFSFSTTTLPEPTAHDVPLWPGTMAGMLWLTGSEQATIRLAGLLNIFLMAGAAGWVVALLKRKPFGCSLAGQVLAAGVMFFLPEMVPYSLLCMPEAMMLFFLCGALNFYFRGVYERRGYLLGAAAFFALAILSKPISLPLAGSFLFALLFILPRAFPKRILWVCACCVVIVGMLSPWILRNRAVFGNAGLTSISGTNLYGCNWGWMVEQWPEPRRSEALAQNQHFEASLEGMDAMTRAKAQGAYARDAILSNFTDYALFTLRQHPRLYFGTGTIALLRYLGQEGACAALKEASGIKTHVEAPTPWETVLAWGLQGVSLVFLAIGYLIILVGMLKGGWRALKSKSLFSSNSVAFLSAFGGILLLAVVIGPVVATRYRVAMVPFFAILASMALCRTTPASSNDRSPPGPPGIP